MKVLVLSDSHGEFDAMVRAAEKESPEMIFHLGDGWREAQALSEQFPEIPFYQVAGNCDARSRGQLEQTLIMEGKRILLCHGHTFEVKQGLRRAKEIVEERRLDAFLFGHTHKPQVEMWGNVLLMNPGSIGAGYPPSYGILTVEPGKIDGRIVQLALPKRRFW